MVEATNHHTALGPLTQVDAGLLNVGYADIGPAHGRAAMLLHGWPYDIHSYAEVAPLLAAAGYRVVVPYLRGFGTTRFRSDATFRNGEQAALAVDVIALLDAPRSSAPSLPASTGAPAPPTSSRRCGRNAARGLSR